MINLDKTETLLLCSPCPLGMWESRSCHILCCHLSPSRLWIVWGQESCRLKKFYWFFRDRGREKRKRLLWEHNIDGLPRTHPLLRINSEPGHVTWPSNEPAQRDAQAMEPHWPGPCLLISTFLFFLGGGRGLKMIFIYLLIGGALI